MEFALRKAIGRTGTVLAICACSVFATHATLSPAFAENRIMGPAKGRFAQQLPTPRCDGFEDYMRDAGNFVVDGVEYLGEKTIKSTIGMGKLLAGNPSALIDEIDGTFKDLGTAAATLSKYTPLALISVIVDELPPGGFTSFLKSGVRFQDQLREGVAMGMAQNLNPLKQVRTIYSDGTEVFGDIGKVLINLDDPLAAGNEFLKLNQKWTGAGALTYMLTEKDPMTGLKKALNAMHRQIELVTNHAGPNGKVASAVFDYAMGESKKLINKIPDPKDKQVAALLAATFATTFKQTLKDPNYKRNGYNVSRHPFYFADIRELPTEWMGNDHNSGGKYDWGMDRARVEDYPGCISLGDYAYTDKHRKTIPAVCGVENGRNKWWSRPIDYKLVWGDNCSGGTHDRSVWQPVCKQGYISVGFVAGRGSWKKPKPNRIACVKNDPHLFTVVNGISAGLKFTANDKNSGAKFDITTYDRTFEGLKLTHAVPFARNKGDQRFVQSLRVAVVVPGIAPSGKNSHCAQFYAESGYRGRTTRVCATGRRNYKKSLAGGNGQMRRGFKSFHCGLGVAALKFYKGSRDQNPRIRPCDISNSNRIPLADYRGITHVEVLAHYFDPDDPKREFFSPEHQQVRLELEKACNTGTNPQACLNLAQSSTRRHDWTQAYGAIDAVRRFGLACEGNVKGACKAYRQTASSLCKAGESKACGLSQNADRLTQLTGLRADLDAKRLACNAGSPQSCADFGQSLFRIGGASVQGGTNQPPEWTEGVAVYQKLCDANFNDSCQQLKQLAGNMCISKMGKGCTITGQFRIKDAPKGYEAANRKAAIKDYEKGCNWGDEEGCQEFARTRVQDAYSDPKSSKRRLAALQGANQSTLDGTQSKTPTNNRAKDSAVQTLLESCQRGNQRSCDMHEGYLGELNSELQSDYFKCVGLGETKSCTAYGIAVEGAEKGTITKNPVSTKDGSSTYFYKEACQGVFVSGAMTKGDGEACMILGNKTLSGEDGTPANKREANSIGNFVLGCETLGHAESCLMAAKVIVGPTMPQSQKYYAAIYERKACEAGSQSACDMLLARTVDLNNAGQKPGDTRATAESCALRTTFTDFDASSQLDLEPGKLKTKFSNSGSSPLTLKFRVNQSTESEWATIQPRESIEIEDYKNRTYVLLDANQQCVGAAKLVSDNQHLTYAAAADVVHQTAPNGNSGKSANNTAPVKPPKSGAIKVTLDAAQNCHLHGSLASNDTGVAAMTTFENTGMEPLYVYWLDEKGQDSDYQRTGNALAIVEPGTATSIQTGIGLAYSVFSIANGQTNCVGITSIEDVNTHVTMNSDNGTVNANTPANTTGKVANQNNPSITGVSGAQQLGSCAQNGTMVSASTGDPANMTLTNTGADDLYVYWINQNGDHGDYNGDNTPISLVAAGHSAELQVQIGDAYAVYDAASNCIGVTPQLSAASAFTASSAAGSANSQSKTPQPTAAPQDTATLNQTQPTANQAGNQDQLTIGTGNSCKMRGSVVSELSGQSASVSFANNGSETIYVYWLDENGTDTDYDYSGNPVAAIAPGDSQTLKASVGFAYSIFSNVNGQIECVGVTQLKSTDTLVSVIAGGNTHTADDDEILTPSQDSQQDQSDANISDNLAQIRLSAGENCQYRGSVDSSDAGDEAQVSFTNRGADVAYVYWVDESGAETDYDYSGNPLAAIEPGGSQAFESREGFIYSAFSVVNGETVCIGMTEVEAPSVSIEIYDTDGN